MKKYSTFHFSGYSWNHHAGKITLRYSLDKELKFEELLQLPEPVSDERLKARHWQIERLLRSLHIIGGISYFKTCLPKKIAFDEDEPLSRDDAQFWNTVYEEGLGEFFFQNKIDFRGLINFPTGRTPNQRFPNNPPLSPSRVLLPIGGGKDSVVSAELLKKAGLQPTLFRMNENEKITELSHQLGLPLLNVRRTLDPTLFKLNSQGALNGHVPITAYVSILSCLLAELYDFDTVAMSNERSANIGNVHYLDKDVNHQWSKSLQFEKMLRKFLKGSVDSPVEYASILRPLSELKIVEVFSGYPKYFAETTSCNTNWKIDDEVKKPLWCGKCPKCAFVFACMAAFVDKTTLIKTFGSNFFENADLLDLYRELLGIKDFKPFECVGTPEETKAAFLLIQKRGELSKTPIMQMFEKEVLPNIKNPKALIEEVMNSSKDHCLSPALLNVLL